MDGNVDAARRRVVRLGPTRAMVWARAVVLALAAFGTGAVSHVAAGGLVPGAFASLLVLASCVPLAAVFLLRRASVARLVLLVVAGQTYVHTALSALAGHRGDAPERLGAYAVSPVRTDTGGSLYDQFAASSAPGAGGGGGSDWFAHQLTHLTGQSPWMVLAHTGGAVALGLFLAVGEDALWRWLALALARVQVARCADVWAGVALGIRRGVALRAAVLPLMTTLVHGSQLLARPVDRHRGPPFLLAA